MGGHHAKRAAGGGLNIPEFGYITTHTGGNDSDPSILGASLGAADADRFIILCVGNSGSRAVVSCTVGGQTASEVVTLLDGNTRATILIAAVPSGTTGDIEINFGGGPSWYTVDVYRMVKRDGIATALDTDSANFVTATVSMNINRGAGGCTVAKAQTRNGNTSTWSGITEDSDVDPDTSDYGSSASSYPDATATGDAVSDTVASAPAAMAGVIASWA